MKTKLTNVELAVLNNLLIIMANEFNGVPEASSAIDQRTELLKISDVNPFLRSDIHEFNSLSFYNNLHKKLNEAIKKEDYKSAAILRDQINAVKIKNMLLL